MTAGMPGDRMRAATLRGWVAVAFVGGSAFADEVPAGTPAAGSTAPVLASPPFTPPPLVVPPAAAGATVCKQAAIGTAKEYERILDGLRAGGATHFLVVGDGLLCGWP